MPGADDIRDAQRAAWAGLSAGWEKWDAVIMEQLAPVGAAMIERLDIMFGARPRDTSVPCTSARGCATLPNGTSMSNS